MIEPGMYSILLKWGLDTLSTTVLNKDPRHLQIVLEAIKLRNSLVVKRFEYAWLGANAVLDLNVELDSEIRKITISSNAKSPKAGARAIDDFLSQLRNEIHPMYHRRLKRIRGNFEATNDLFSAYSIEFWNMLRFENLNELFKKCKTRSDVSRTYRHAWTLYGDVMLTLIRVSSYDLRFWLSDVSYFDEASKQASSDRKAIERQVRENIDETWSLSLENQKKVTEFWSTIKS